VLRALREDDIRPTAIVSIAYDTEERSRGESARRTAVDDLRASIEALASDEGALLRAIKRPLTIDNIGRQRLGNLVINSIAHGFDDYAQASMWLGEQLGIAGAVLPATVTPVQRRIEFRKSPRGRPGLRGRMSFVGDSLRSPRAAVTAIARADWVLLAPGSLYRSVIATAAVPDLARALRRTPAPVLWIASPEPESGELGAPVGIAELELLRSHGIRVDAVVYDCQEAHGFDRGELLSCGVEAIPRRLDGSGDLASGDPKRLRRALAGLIRAPGSADVESPA
jgi:uncharacterized cofD-like protein